MTENEKLELLKTMALCNLEIVKNNLVSITKCEEIYPAVIWIMLEILTFGLDLNDKEGVEKLRNVLNNLLDHYIEASIKL